ncbi:hypothetical protein [Variovorax sp. IB41]|uniref:hypothetical protein n=1 Tax=Variovorax sp. IB41 TaxID=2779370 RepID=UPI0018E7F211|nr:hypothetical protein [Variovorax sp. IB41]MBJ2157770.1 hypothetical protein [Variovorax sp. IB41]
MDPRIHDALARCLHAINLDHAFGYYPSAEQKAQLDALAIGIQPLIEALAAEPYAGKGLGCGYLGHRGYRTPWAAMMYRLRDSRSSHSLSWKDRLEVLFDTAGLDATEMLAWTLQVEDDILRDHLLLHIAADLAIEGDMARVEEEITPRLRPDMAHRADRVLLMEYARRGDVDAFLRKHKKASQRQERHTLLDARALLVEQMATQQGLDAALRFSEATQGFGDSYRAAAMRTYAATVDVATMRAWIAAHATLFATAPGLEEELLVTAYAKGPRPDSIDDDDPFDELFARVDAIDKSLRHGDARLRDGLLLDLGIAVGPGARRLQCRKKIGNASIKRELDSP